MIKPILKLTAGLGVLYAFVGFLAVPYVIKNIVPDKVSEATNGGVFSVESASFNPFTFHLTLKQLAFKTPQKQDFFTLQSFSLNVDPLAYLWKGAWVIHDVRLRKPHIAIDRDAKGDFNFKWLSELGSNEPEAEKSSEPLKLIINHFGLKNGTLNYRDYAEGNAYVLDVGPVGFNLDNIDLRDLSSAEGKMRLYATINEGGFIDLSGKVDALSPLKIGGSVAFDSGKLYTPWRYFKEKFPIEVADGSAAFGFDYRFDSNDVNATELTKLHFEVDKLRIIPKGEQRNLFTLSSLRLNEGKVQPLKKEFSARSLELSGINLAAERSREGEIDWMNYLEALQKAFPEDENETKEPWNFALGSVAVENVGVQWSDNAPREPYRASLSNLRLHTGTVSSDETSLLNLSLITDALRVTRQRDDAIVLGLEGVSVEGIALDRAGKFAAVQTLSLLGPNVTLKRLSDGSIDLSRYAYVSSVPSKSSNEAPWGYKVDEIDVNNGEVAFVDEFPARHVSVNLDQLHLNLKGFDSNPTHKNDLMFSTRINEKSSLELNGGLIRSPISSKGVVNVKNLDVTLADPYISPSTYASLRRGKLSVNADYDYNSVKTAVKGKVALEDWVVNDTRDDSVLLGWESIGATPFVYAYPANALRINQLAIDGFYTNALIDAKKVLNFSTLSKNTAMESNGSKGGNPFGIDIVKLLLRNSSATFSDLSLPLPFKTYIHDLQGSVLGISTTKDVRTFVKLRGGVDQYGLAKVDGSLNTKAPKKFTDIKVAFDNLELKGYTPYSLEFLGYKIDGGKLFLDLGYKIDEGKLHGANRVVIKQIELGAEKEGGSPWPLRFVVALLEDSDGVIDIDLPIEGDVNNPDFKYGKVVWQVIGNLFTKAVTSPFRLLGSMMGIDSEKLATIDFEAGSAVLSPPQIEKLDLVTTMLTKRPKLGMNVYGSWDEAHDVYALKSDKLVQIAQKQVKKVKIDSLQAIPVDVLEAMAEESLDKKEGKVLKAKLEEQYLEEAAFVRHYSDALIEKLVPIQAINPQELQTLGAQRAAAIQNYLVKTPGFEKRVTIKEIEKVKGEKADVISTRLEIVVP
ncbi:DUF748 domain-containing protein [Sulfuricurvum sp.]|uniref:DUF748 domain-containing protein n=1 Tax=Sulfuricurvum sp. TaxID=2025608 RepID=UPI0026320187|nr:DUF748 domain-containing protein [Sulfuricurvum sp.]MDD2781278.1 DUF748 domain-containing protein [Sulfuricurvum sp.]